MTANAVASRRSLAPYGRVAGLGLGGLAILSGALPAMAAGLVAVVAWIAWEDLKTLTIRDEAVAAFLVLACGLRWHEALARAGTPGWAVVALVVDAALPGLSLWLCREVYYRRRGVDGLGFGDVKLAFAGGALVGPLGFADALCAASAVALVCVGLRALVAGAPRQGDKIALGAALAPALGAVWFWQSGSLLMPVTAG